MRAISTIIFLLMLGVIMASLESMSQSLESNILATSSDYNMLAFFSFLTIGFIVFGSFSVLKMGAITDDESEKD